jgi:C-terminal processing protease CtpA/Prc
MWGTWTGPLYVLTAGRTYSAAEGFAATLQNNHAAKILGSQTGGDGCGFMNGTKPVVLPNSGLRFRLPNCVRIRADGTDEVAGVKPNFPILPKEGEDALARAQRTLDTLYADLKATLAIR